VVDKKPDLILLDVNLGIKKLDGYKICYEVKTNSETSNIPVEMMSGTDEELDVLKAFESGANVFLKKPFSKDDI